MTDKELLEGLNAGGETPQYEAAARYIIAIYAPKVMGYVMQNNGTKADGWDICIDTIEAVTKNIQQNKYAEDGRFAAYFMRIARNKWLDELRKRKPDQRTMAEMPNEAADETEETLLKGIFEDDTDAAIKFEGALLPTEKLRLLWEKWPEPHGKLLLTRFYVDDIKSKQLAEEAGISDNTMRQQLRRYRLDFQSFVKINGRDLFKQ